MHLDMRVVFGGIEVLNMNVEVLLRRIHGTPYNCTLMRAWVQLSAVP